MKFILPRLLGLALLAGAASFLLAMIFKLLIGIVMIGSVVYLATRVIGKWYRHNRQAPYAGPQYPDRYYGYGPQQQAPFGPQQGHAGKMYKEPAIIPIN